MGSRVRHWLAAGVVAVLALALAGCASPDDGGPGGGETLTIGSQNTVESRIIAQLYGQSLEHAGWRVDYNTGVGDRAAYTAALQAGIIDIIPETSGALLYATDAAAFAHSPEDVVDALPDALSELGLHVLRSSPAENADAFVVTREFSESNQVTSIGDLAYLSTRITIGSSADFESGPYGRLGLRSAYDLNGFAFKVIDDGGGLATVGQLLTGAVQVSVIPSTTPAISRNDLVVLSDPNSLITAQNVLPLVNAAGAVEGVAEVLDPLSRELTTADLRELNDASTNLDGPTPERIARAWLEENVFVDD
jgi:osmoprotectant transport system substrate-binding protein